MHTTPMTRLSTTEARAQFSDVLERVAFKGERVVIARHGKVLGAIVSAEDLALLEHVRALEDEADAAAVQAWRAAEKRGEKPIPYGSVRRRLGL
jgi:prevent-host-death family protein